MGKAGKARKRQRLERELFTGGAAAPSTLDHDEEETLPEASATTTTQSHKRPRPDLEEGGEDVDDLACSTQVLEMLGRRLDLYQAKVSRPSRRYSMHMLLQPSIHRDLKGPACVKEDETYPQAHDLGSQSSHTRP